MAHTSLKKDNTKQKVEKTIRFWPIKNLADYIADHGEDFKKIKESKKSGNFADNKIDKTFRIWGGMESKLKIVYNRLYDYVDALYDNCMEKVKSVDDYTPGEVLRMYEDDIKRIAQNLDGLKNLNGLKSNEKIKVLFEIKKKIDNLNKTGGLIKAAAELLLLLLSSLIAE